MKIDKVKDLLKVEIWAKLSLKVHGQILAIIYIPLESAYISILIISLQSHKLLSFSVIETTKKGLHVVVQYPNNQAAGDQKHKL